MWSDAAALGHVHARFEVGACLEFGKGVPRDVKRAVECCGGLDVLFDNPVRRTAHACVGCLNKRHMLFAWLSLFWVGFSDVYVRLCSMGIWTDWKII